MNLDVLPVRTGNAPENMAHDFLLLQRYPQAETARFRHYRWRGPAWTFGYSQKVAFVRAQIPAGNQDLCRRPTGGGVVDHTDDWTYALVVPRAHPLEAIRATESYRAVHECLAAALRVQGVPVRLARADESGAMEGGVVGPGVCFRRAEIFDVVHERTGEKVAGAAQKRNKSGLLVQGSLWKPACGTLVDWIFSTRRSSPGSRARKAGLSNSPAGRISATNRNKRSSSSIRRPSGTSSGRESADAAPADSPRAEQPRPVERNAGQP